MKVLFVLSVFCLLLAVISAKKHYEENVESLDAESREHSGKKYSKEHQKSHFHGHKHKKLTKEEKLVEEPHAKSAPVDVPEVEAELQGNIETNKKAVHDHRQKEQVEDMHLQDLAYEESLKKDKKKKKNHHGAHHAEVVEKNEERKLFSEHEGKNPAEKKVIEDSFEPLTDAATDGEKKSKSKDKKSKNKKKAYEKSNKDKSKKSKDGKKKNKDKKNKNKDKKKW